MWIHLPWQGRNCYHWPQRQFFLAHLPILQPIPIGPKMVGPHSQYIDTDSCSVLGKVWVVGWMKLSSCFKARGRNGDFYISINLNSWECYKKVHKMLPEHRRSWDIFSLRKWGEFINSGMGIYEFNKYLLNSLLFWALDWVHNLFHGIY